MSKGIARIGFVITLVGTFLFALGGSALAVGPHGGYSATTDYCLQCHSVHSQPTNPNTGQYALLAATNVTAICQTCHQMYQAANLPSGAIQPNVGPGAMSPTSTKGVYTVTGAALTTGGQHPIGAPHLGRGAHVGLHRFRMAPFGPRGTPRLEKTRRRLPSQSRIT